MYAVVQNQPEHFNWTVHSTVLEKVVAFLQSHKFVPEQLNIQTDGWAEAYFTYSADADIKPVWYWLERRGTVEISHPMYEMEWGEVNVLRVKFRIKPPLTRWQRIKRLVS